MSVLTFTERNLESRILHQSSALTLTTELSKGSVNNNSLILVNDGMVAGIQDNKQTVAQFAV